MTRHVSLPAFCVALSLVVFAGAASAQNTFGQADQGKGGFGQMQQPQQRGGLPQHPSGLPEQRRPNTEQPGYSGQQPGTSGQQPGHGVQTPGLQGQNAPKDPTQAQIDPQFPRYLDQLAQYERQDLGVPATRQLHTGAMHGATPTTLPGGQVITTRGLVELMQGRQVPYLIFDVLGGRETLPGAIPAVQASYAGSFDDRISQQMGDFLERMTKGNRQMPLVFYCLSRECWMSYNAALRAINLGYTNVLWYRGGLEAWAQAGGSTVPTGGG